MYRIIILISFLLFSKAFSQLREYDFDNICDFIAFNKTNDCYLSTINGLYEFTGYDFQRLNINISGTQNFQSKTIWTGSQNLWVTTYDKLINYNCLSNMENHYQIKENGIIKNSDYHLFDVIDSFNILLKQDEDLYNFNVNERKFEKLTGSIDGRRLKRMACLSKFGKKYIYCNYLYTSKPGVLEISLEGCSIFTNWHNWDSKELLQDVINIDSINVILASTKNLFLANLYTKNISPLTEVSNWEILCCHRIGANRYWLSTKRKGVFEFSLDNSKISKIFPVYFNAKISNFPINRIEVSPDSTIILSSFENKIFTYNSLSSQFNISHQLNQIECGIIHKNNLYYLNKSKNKSQLKISDSDVFNTNVIKLIGNDNNNLSSYILLKEKYLGGAKHKDFLKSNYIDDKTVYRSFIDNSTNIMYSIFKGDLIDYHDRSKLISDNIAHKTINYFSNIIDYKFLISENAEKLFVYDSSTKKITYLWDFSADICNHIFIPEEEILYLSTSQGMFVISMRDSSLKKVIPLYSDQMEECNCILKYKNLMWGTTKNEVFRYDILENKIIYYSYNFESDKITFIRNGCVNFEKYGYFIYNKGIVKVDLDNRIEPNDYSNIHIYNLKINDNFYTRPKLFEYFTSTTFTHKENTLSFNLGVSNLVFKKKLIAKYRLFGKDLSWINVESPKNEIRYSNLKPGNYVLRVQLQEIAGGEVEKDKSIYINILPPFWMTWWFRSLSIFSLLALSFFVIRTYYRNQLEKKNQKLREQQLIIDKQEAVEKERTRIASEMHDDLGSGLTTIRYLSDRALVNVKSEEEKQQIGKIAEQSNALVRNMSEIIWAMNSRFDTLDNLISYIRRYAFEYLEQFNIKIGWASDEIPELKITGTERRNVFLVCKEILHNIVKHAKANQVEFKIGIAKDKLSIAIKDNGIGFDPSVSEEKGNGLYNMRKRMEQIGGRMEFVGKVDGAEVILSITLIV